MKKICIKIQLCIHPQRDRHQGAVYHLGLSPEVGLGPEISVIAVLRQGHALHHTELSLYDACWEVLVYHHDVPYGHALQVPSRENMDVFEHE